MLILYFHIFQSGFEVSNAIFQASVYVTIVVHVGLLRMSLLSLIYSKIFPHLAE